MSVFGGVKNGGFFRCLEVSEVAFIRIHMSQSCYGCIFEVFCVVGIKKMHMPTLKCRFYLCVGSRTCTSFFRCLEALEGTFVRISKLFGMHIGSLLSGLCAGKCEN